MTGLLSWTAWAPSRTRLQWMPQTTPTRRPGKAWLRWRRRRGGAEPLSSSRAADTSVRDEAPHMHPPNPWVGVAQHWHLYAPATADFALLIYCMQLWCVVLRCVHVALQCTELGLSLFVKRCVRLCLYFCCLFICVCCCVHLYCDAVCCVMLS